MLVSVLLIIYNLSVAFAVGLAFIRLLSSLFNLPLRVANHPTIVVFMGWVFMAMLLQCYHLFLPIGAMAHVYIFVVIALFGLLWFKPLVKDAITSLHQITTKKHLALTLGYTALLLLNICARNATGDIGDYHLQAIRWMEEYAVVPGVGNIRRQLANNSNWFLLNAFSGLSFLGLRSVYTINACLALMIALFALPNLNQKFWLRNLLVLLYFIVVATRKYTGAVTNDLVITGGIILLFCWFTDVVNQPQKQPLQFVLMMVLTATLVTFKLSALPMLMFALGILIYMLWHKCIGIKQVFILICFGGLLFVPWFITNIINSGYLLFPMLGSNWFGVDWEMRPEIVFYEVYANLAYARAPLVDIEVSRYYSFAQWWPHWITSLDYFSIMLMLTTIALLLMLFVWLMINKPFRKNFISHYYHVVLLTCLPAFLLWFTHGPTPRFIFGYMVFIIAMGINLFSNHWPQKLLFKHKFKVIAALLSCMLVVFYITNYSFKKTASVVLLPPPYAQASLNMVAVSNGQLLVPTTNQQCWDANLPCTNLPDTGIVFRGSTLQQGFKINK